MSQYNLRFVDFNDEREAARFHGAVIRPSDYGAAYMATKVGFYNVYAENLRDPAVQILKETLLSAGGEAVTNRDVLIHQAGRSAVLMLATKKQFQAVIGRLKKQQFGLDVLATELETLFAAIATRERAMAYDGGELVFGRKTLIMGILNCTPDSFSDGGQWSDRDRAVDHALAMEAAGADIIDIGGESTRPGSESVSAAEEMDRVLPVIEALKGKLTVPISIDTYKAETAKVALAAGAVIINDVWGFQYDDGEMAAVAAAAGCPVILMHNKTEAVYDDVVAEVTAFLRRSIDIAVAAGVDPAKIIVDPGFGFGKNADHNLLLTAKLKELTSLGCPVLMAASRKKTIGLLLDAPPDRRLFGDAAVTALSILNGADMVRVHDVAEMAQVAKVADAVKGARY